MQKNELVVNPTKRLSISKRDISANIVKLRLTPEIPQAGWRIEPQTQRNAIDEIKARVLINPPPKD